MIKFINITFVNIPSTLLTWLSAFWFIACGGHSNVNLKDALRDAGTNRIELDKVIQHYQDDEEKYAAAVFLISNMKFHGESRGEQLNTYRLFYELYSEMGNDSFDLIDSIQSSDNHYDIGNLRFVPDLKSIPSETLIGFIDDSFECRKRYPWCRNVRPEDFMAYVLPYRLADEQIGNADTNKQLRTIFRHELDSLSKVGCTEPLDVAQVIIKKWNEKQFRWTGKLPHGPGLGTAVSRIKAGTCREFAHGIVYILRACGIPAGIDYMPLRGDDNASHQWPFVKSGDGKTYIASIENPHWIPADKLDIKAGKIYRQEYAVNETALQHFTDNSMQLTYFNPPMYTDVTNEYTETFNLNFPVKEDTCTQNGDILFLCSPNHDEWEPIAFASVADSECSFREVAGDIVALLCKYENGQMIPVSDAFEITNKGTIRNYKPSGSMQQVTVFSKFPISEKNGDVVNRVVGGRFEGSNDSGFSNPVLIYEIKDSPFRRINKIVLTKPAGPFKYVRYIGAENTHCNIAEVLFFSDKSSAKGITGEVIGTPGDRSGKLTHDYTKVFDGDLLTSFDYRKPSGGWAGLAFDEPQKIRSIVYSPRNRDNFISKGDEYELFYFDRKWISIGRKIAESDSISFEAPSGALLFMKNITNGTQERVFEIDKRGQQKFR